MWYFTVDTTLNFKHNNIRIDVETFLSQLKNNKKNLKKNLNEIKTTTERV